APDNVLRGKHSQEFAAKAKIFLAQSQLLQRPFYRQAQFLHQRVGLDHVAVSSQVQGRDGGGHGGYGSNQDERRGVARLAGVLQQLDPRQVRHADIANDQVIDLRLDFLFGALAVRNRFHQVALFAKDDFQNLAKRFFVIDDQQSRHSLFLNARFQCTSLALRAVPPLTSINGGASRGKSITNRAPFPGWEYTWM